ncbi:hypothetical protein GCM10016455_05770 [Aliiroseovarius zhejiangensis]|uniref:Uncharacterized protein n=1 Tax=Aliiroseovarius zhejiangensis TaxID=1632025 RepID=A0ABQ3IRB6_9RHOB|nr:hypothetical protein [Aliiroseovarius zhejiangensis]GHE88485.1 hypothetical protein GCM10016455_05770 [Aliiroseovarius zhejiangensis]
MSEKNLSDLRFPRTNIAGITEDPHDPTRAILELKGDRGGVRMRVSVPFSDLKACSDLGDGAVQDTSCPDDSAEVRRTSAETLVASVLDGAEFADVLRAVVYRFNPVHIQSAQAKAVARYLGKDEETVRRWLHEITTPKARDVWPLFFVVILAELPVATQKHVIKVLMGLADD